MFFLLLDGQITQEEYLRHNNISINFAELPSYVYGLLYKYKDYFLITINRNLSFSKMKETFLHEILHFEKHHCEIKNDEDTTFEFREEDIEQSVDLEILRLKKKYDI